MKIGLGKSMMDTLGISVDEIFQLVHDMVKGANTGAFTLDFPMKDGTKRVAWCIHMDERKMKSPGPRHIPGRKHGHRWALVGFKLDVEQEWEEEIVRRLDEQLMESGCQVIS